MAIDRRKDSKNQVLRNGEIQRKDGRYMFSYPGWGGKRRHVYAKTLKELRVKEEKIRREIDNGIQPGAADQTSLNQLFDLYISQAFHLGDRTRNNYLSAYNHHVRQDFGKRPISKIKHSDLKKLYQVIVDERGIKLSTLKNIHTPIYQAFSLAVEDDLLLKNPAENLMKDVKKSRDWIRKKRKALTIKEQEIFMDGLRSNKQFAGFEPVVTILLGTGMRVGECLGLRWCDVDMENRKIYVKHSLTYAKFKGDECAKRHITKTKTSNSVRMIPMTGAVYNSFLKQYEYQCITGFYQGSIDGYTDFIFLNERGDVLLPAAINSFLERARKVINQEQMEIARWEGTQPVEIPHFHNHILRHTFCTRCAEAEVPVDVLMRLTGHTRMSTLVEYYIDVSDDRLEDYVDFLNNKIV